MASRVETLEQKIERLQAQLQQAKAIEREKERKQRTRQSIIGFTTIQTCLENGTEVHLKTPNDLEAFLRQHVKGSNNRKTWGFEAPSSGKADTDRQQQSKTKTKKPDTTQAKKTSLSEGPGQEELTGEFNL
ncbi:MAG: hypothetical protein AAF609_13615 [Cyanobacteria bacterium P01_C01_bin.120]